MKPRNLSQLRLYPGLYVLFHRTTPSILRGKIDEMPAIRRNVAAIGIEASVEPLSEFKPVGQQIPFQDRGLVRRASPEHDSRIRFAGQYRMNARAPDLTRCLHVAILYHNRQSSAFRTVLEFSASNSHSALLHVFRVRWRIFCKAIWASPQVLSAATSDAHSLPLRGAYAAPSEPQHPSRS